MYADAHPSVDPAVFARSQSDVAPLARGHPPHRWGKAGSCRWAPPLPTTANCAFTRQARRLWGDVYFQPRTRGFRRKPPEGGGPRSFVQFVLEPLYKLVTLTISEPEADVRLRRARPLLPCRTRRV